MPSAGSPVEALRAALRGAGIPESAHLDLTYRCDLDCEHCYLDRKDDWPELTTEGWVDVLEQLAAWGTFRLTLSGGEVFARPDIDVLLAHIERLGFIYKIKTHAGNVDDALAQRFGRGRPVQFDVSVYSLSPQVHDAVTRVEGSHARTIAGVAALRRAGLPVKIAIKLFRANLAECESMRDYFQAMGCEVSITAELLPDNHGSTSVIDLELDELAMIAFERAQLRAAEAGRAEIMEPGALLDRDRPCGVGRTTIYIGPDGALQPCAVFPAAIGHVRAGPIAEQWERSTLRQELAAWNNHERQGCQSCAAAGQCAYCAATAYKETGDFRVAPPRFHERTRLRAKAWEEETGVAFGPAFWASVPDAAAARPVRRKSPFPIYRPEHAPRRGAR